MKKTIFTLLSIALIALLSCVSDEGTATVNISFSSADAFPAGFVTRDTSYGPGVVPVEVAEIRIGVFAGSVELRNRLLLGIYPADVETATIVVDSGSARIFVVEGRNADGYPIYTGYSSPMSLQAGEIIDLPISMQKYATATININLYEDDNNSAEGSFGPPFNIAGPANGNLLGSEVLVSIVSANSEIFYEDPIVVACNGVGDFYNEFISNSSNLNGIEVPANQFLVVVVRGYNISAVSGLGVGQNWISYIGAANPSGTSALVPDSVNEVDVEMAPGADLWNWTTAGAWESYCECIDAPVIP